MPNPDLLIAPYVKREAVASSRIEERGRICLICCWMRSSPIAHRQERRLRDSQLCCGVKPGNAEVVETACSWQVD